MPFGIGFFASGADSDYRLIESKVLTTATSLLTFSNIPQSFKHLQIRATWRSDGAVTSNASYLRMNGDSGAKYASHRLQGDGAGVGSSAYQPSVNNAWVGYPPGANAAANQFGGLVLDILDYSSTSKNTTYRSFDGSAGINFIGLYSGVFIDTSAITSVEFFHNNGSWVAGSRFSLYGIRG